MNNAKIVSNVSNLVYRVWKSAVNFGNCFDELYLFDTK